MSKKFRVKDKFGLLSLDKMEEYLENPTSKEKKGSSSSHNLA